MKRSTVVTLAGAAVWLSLTALFAAPASNAPATDEKAMMTEYYTAQCGSPCSFMVGSHDKKEVVAAIIAHAKSHHDMNVSEKDAEAMVKKTDAPK